jgi:ketol-acid reductoisomerase
MTKLYLINSSSAQRGALDWWKPFYTASKPVFEDLYESTKNGSETARSLDRNSEPDYREKLEAELAEISDSEMWRYVMVKKNCLFTFKILMAC